MMKIRIVFKSIGKRILAFLNWILKIIKQIPGLLGEKPILSALIFLIIIGFVVLRITMSIEHEENSFIGNIIAEGYGVVFDIFVFGILIAFFNLLGENRRDIKRWKEEIDDFRYWENDEAKFRIVGNIRRLNKAGVSDIGLMYCYLKGAKLVNAKLSGANLRLVNLKEANLAGAYLEGAYLWRASLDRALLGRANLKLANLWGAYLGGTSLWRANLEGANLVGARLTGANLWRANLRKANLERANLERANLEGAIFIAANLKGVINLSLAQLSKVKTLYRAKLDLRLEAQVRKKFPHLLKEFIEIWDGFMP